MHNRAYCAVHAVCLPGGDGVGEMLLLCAGLKADSAPAVRPFATGVESIFKKLFAVLYGLLDATPPGLGAVALLEDRRPWPGAAGRQLARPGCMVLLISACRLASIRSMSLSFDLLDRTWHLFLCGNCVCSTCTAGRCSARCLQEVMSWSKIFFSTASM